MKDRVDLRRPPGSLVLGATVRRALADGPLVTRVSRLSPLGVLGAMLERPILRFLVDLGDALLPAGDDQIDLRLFSAHQRTHYLFDDSKIGKRGKALRNPH